MGDASGASIPHLHLHVVPRYPRELGFMDVISGARIIIEDPNVTQEKLAQIFQELTIQERNEAE
jgi:ATP adenylyltransferase